MNSLTSRLLVGLSLTLAIGCAAPQDEETGDGAGAMTVTDAQSGELTTAERNRMSVLIQNNYTREQLKTLKELTFPNPATAPAWATWGAAYYKLLYKLQRYWSWKNNWFDLVVVELQGPVAAGSGRRPLTVSPDTDFKAVGWKEGNDQMRFFTADGKFVASCSITTGSETTALNCDTSTPSANLKPPKPA